MESGAITARGAAKLGPILGAPGGGSQPESMNEFNRLEQYAKLQRPPREISDAFEEQRLKDQRQARFHSVEQALAFTIQAAEHHICRAESYLSEIEASLKRADSSIAVLRAVALRAGLELPDKPLEPQEGRRFISRELLAEEMGISVRRIDQHRKNMIEGDHYHKDGSRILFHCPEAIDFILAVLSPTLLATNIEQLAVAEVARRRNRRKSGNSTGGSGQ